MKLIEQLFIILTRKNYTMLTIHKKTNKYFWCFLSFAKRIGFADFYVVLDFANFYFVSYIS
jgi:phosphoglycerol transferase MdoB-like AlkP superfamily enzyme